MDHKEDQELIFVKRQNSYPSCQIYQGTCNCGETYIGETVRNVKTRWDET